MSDQAQPGDLAAEGAVLGAMMTSRDLIEPALDILTSEDFYRPNHGHIFDACVNLYTHGEPVDATSVHASLQAANINIPLPDLVGLIAAAGWSTSNVRKYADIVRHHKLRRGLIDAGMRVSSLGRDETGLDGKELIEQAESIVHDVSAEVRREVRLARIGDKLSDWLDTVGQRQEHEGLAGISTGWDNLDGYLAGLRGGQLITVAARPSMGKSMWAGALALNVAEAGHPVLFVSAEMSADELMDRFMAQISSVPLDDIRRGKVSPIDWQRISHNTLRVEGLPLYVADEASSTLLSIRSAARRVAASAGSLGLIIVDYLQLLTPGRRNENRQVEVAELSRGLKKLAMDMAVPVISLAQLNRNLEMRGVTDRRPRLSDLRESGAIENDSDVVMFLYRDEVYVERSERAGICDVIIAKQRNGPIGDVGLYFEIRTGRYRAAGERGTI